MGRAAPPVLPAGKASLGKAQAGAGRATPLGAAPSIAGLWHRHQHNPTPRPAGGQRKQQWSLESPEKAMGARGHSWDPGSPRVGTARPPWDERLWCTPPARIRMSARCACAAAPLTPKQSRVHGLLASPAAPSLPRLLGGLSTPICLPLLKEGFFNTQSIPNGTLILICQRQRVPQGRILWPDPARACRMDFFNALVNKLPFSQAGEEQAAQFAVYRLQSPGSISVAYAVFQGELMKVCLQ